MTVFRNVMVYLGLGPDEQYDDGYLYEDEAGYGDEEDVASGPSGAHQSPAFFPPRGDVDTRDSGGTASAVGAVRPLRPVGDSEYDDTYVDLVEAERQAAPAMAEGSQRSMVGAMSGDTGSGFRSEGAKRPSSFGEPAMAPSGLAASRADSVVRAVPIRKSEPVAVVPDSFRDAKVIADEFKRSVPVIMNLQGLERELARRLIDFASGVCYSLEGSMEKIASQVFLLTPKSVEISDEEMRRLEERDYDS